MRTTGVILLTILWVVVPAVAGTDPASHGYLGVGLADAPQGAPVTGAMVSRLDPNGPAARAGILQGDLIRSVNGLTIENARDLQNYVLSQRPGAVLAMELVRLQSSGPATIRVTVTLGLGPGANSAPSPSPALAPGPAVTRSAAPSVPLADESGQAGVKYVRYSDPAENAFTVAVPAGWRVGGRLARYGPITIAPFVQAMTPDGAVFIQLGDWHVKDYCDIPGWREGQLYTPGTSVEFIRRVQTAEQYAHSYAMIFQDQLGCKSPASIDSRTLPNPPELATMAQARVETNLTEFNCQRGGQNYAGRVIVSVQAYRLPTSVGWNIVYLGSVLARQDRAPTAFAVFDKMRNSFAFDSAWSAQQALIARQATRPAMDALNATLQQAQDFDKHVINGLVTLNDPATGSKWDVKMGAAPFYFSDGVGHFYNSYDPNPRPGYHTANPIP